MYKSIILRHTCQMFYFKKKLKYFHEIFTIVDIYYKIMETFILEKVLCLKIGKIYYWIRFVYQPGIFSF